MVCELGMSPALGDLSYAAGAGLGEERRGYSEKEAELIGDETRRLVDEARGLACDVLLGSRAALDRIAAALLERETVSREELELLVAPTAVAG